MFACCALEIIPRRCNEAIAHVGYIGSQLARSEVDATSDHVLGPLGADITLVEYGSYACPYCRAANERIAEVRDRSAIVSATSFVIDR